MASWWIESTPTTNYPAATAPEAFDVVVVGAGITGLTTAHLLARQGARVAVVERRRIAEGTTGNTTAKITSLHRLKYARLRREVGEDAARQYGEANQAGLRHIVTTVADEQIACDLRRLPAYTYTAEADRVPELAEEARVASELGLPASFTTEIDLPVLARAAVRFADQAQFHPRRYCLALAERIMELGGTVFEQTPVVSLASDGPCRVVTADDVELTADRVVLATLLPFPNDGLFSARTEPSRSYALAFHPDVAPTLDGMYLSAETPTRSVRPLEPDGLVIGGDEHRTGHDGHTEHHFRTLVEWAEEHFGPGEARNRWASQDYVSFDGRPFVGPITGGNDRVLVATGFAKWGMTNGTAAAMVLAGTVAGDPPAWAGVFDSTRRPSVRSVPSHLRAQTAVAVDFVKDRVGPHLSRSSPDDLDVGEGAVMTVGGERVAVSRGEDGRLHALSSNCTHLGCVVHWNDGERSWDCPCHGSRFDVEGEVLEGPAVRPLEPREIAVAPPV